jgi:hypothetical protein
MPDGGSSLWNVLSASISFSATDGEKVDEVRMRCPK